jgi:hypothetical protein
VPQARSGGSRSTSGAKTTPGSGQAKRSTGGSSARGKDDPSGTRATRSSGGQAAGSTPASSARSTRAKASASSADAGLEAAAQRLRKLNERIIEAGKEAGETTLANYEKALKAIARTLERGPGSSDIDWISNLATTQAKFIRDVTTAWTSAARDTLK